MTSKESLDYLCFIALGNEKSAKKCKETIEKDLDQLEEYRKIGEELGIDLITLFKALKDGIYVYYEDEERYQFHNDLRIEYKKNLGWGLVYIYGSYCRNDMTMKLDMEFYELKDYQKTWALTKEELENDN